MNTRMVYSRKGQTWTDPIGGEVWSRVHPATACKGHRCVIHNPSEHTMSSWPRHLRETGLVERICPHGIGHPDPDSVAYFSRKRGGGWGVHGCDGCCFDGWTDRKFLSG